MGKLFILAAYAVYAAFWIRLCAHILVWWRAVRQNDGPASHIVPGSGKAYALAAGDVFFFGRLFKVNPALWLGEWIFHASFLLVVARHLRFFLNPVPAWVWFLQTPGLIAGYILPLALLYILGIRLLSKEEKYASPANMFLLGLVLGISSIGVLMHALFKPDLVDVKLFIFGLMSFAPTLVPGSVLFLVHFGLVLVLISLLPSHIFTAPIIMLEARKREQALHMVIHEK
jgi:[DsrC]-trisulfide reductase subunit M